MRAPGYARGLGVWVGCADSLVLMWVGPSLLFLCGLGRASVKKKEGISGVWVFRVFICLLCLVMVSSLPSVWCLDLVLRVPVELHLHLEALVLCWKGLCSSMDIRKA